jgi:hypothetical protein
VLTDDFLAGDVGNATIMSEAYMRKNLHNFPELRSRLILWIAIGPAKGASMSSK